jgi:hypothetical protein
MLRVRDDMSRYKKSFAKIDKQFPLTLVQFLFLASVLFSSALYAQTNIVDSDSDGLIDINSLGDLNEIRNDPSGRTLRGSSEGCPSGLCGGFELTRNLNFDTNQNGVLDSGDWNSGKSWVPVTTSGYFRFEGNGHSISNILITVPIITMSGNNYRYNYGLINPNGMVDIQSLQLVNPTIIAEGAILPTNATPHIGVLASSFPTFSIIRKVSIENAVISFSRPSILAPLESFGAVGGFIGSGSGVFEDLHFDGSILVTDTATHLVGGIAGTLNNSTFAKVNTQGALHGAGNLGGIVGSASGLYIWNGYSTVDITSDGSWSGGGIVGALFDGSNPNIIDNVYSVVNLTNGGGLIGYLNTNHSSIEIKSSYSKSIVNAGGQSYAQLIGVVQPTDLVLNLDSYQIIDPEGVSLPSQQGSYNRPVGLGALQCSTNPVSLNCAEPYLLSSWNPQYWNFGSDSELPVLIQQSNYPWHSTDSPGGLGDYESITRMKEHAPQYACDTPIDFQVKEKKSGYVFSAKTPEVFDFFNAKQGLRCTAAQQADGRCDNYEVSYLCGGSSVIPQWSAWASNDTPNDGIDNETIPASVCVSGSSIGIRTRVVNSTVEYKGAPQIPYRFSLTRGFNCLNDDNGRAGKLNCKDYEVRMVCNVNGLLSNSE